MTPVLRSSFLLFFIFLTLLSNQSNAQFPGGGSGKGGGTPAGIPTGGGNGGTNSLQAIMGKMTMAIGHVYGKVMNTKSKKGIGYASVALYTLKTDSLVGGQLTEDNGDFSLDNLPFGGYKLKVTYVGFKNTEQKVIVTPNSAEQDIGNIAIEEGTVLKEVTVSSEKATVELKADRKVFNVDKDLSARGGTGVEVMKNIPGVSVDADGNVTLRNNSPQIYVDGKPTTLTLEQIPADQIDKVEVITNPSAKFEAASSGGIINVVLKKNQKPGYNGIAALGIGTNTQYNGMALINVKEKKFGFMLTYNINSATNRTNGYTDRSSFRFDAPLNKIDTFHSRQDNSTTFKRMFQFARLGFDYYISNRNTISISENMVFGKFTNSEGIVINQTDSAGNKSIPGNRQNTQANSFRNFTTGLNFKHTYPKPDKEWTIDITYNHSKGGGNNQYNTTGYLQRGGLDSILTQLQQSTSGQHSDMVTAQWDFVDPLQKNMKVEFGVRSNYKKTFSNLNTSDYSPIDSLYHTNSTLTNNYSIDDLVNAAYVTFSHSIKGFSYQLGLRLEESYYAGHLLSSGDSTFSYQYPSSPSKFYQMLFPSLNLSQKFGEKHELQFNVTRKIKRPDFFQVSPFIFYSDKFNYRIGNPQLQPEFINKAELNYNLTLPKFNWLSSIYGKYSQQPITAFNYPDPLNPTILINTSENAKNSFGYGWENTVKISAVKKLDITLDGDVFYNNIQGTIGSETINNSGYSYNLKAIVSYKLPLDIIIQANGTYESPKIIAQGKTLPMYYFDLSLSKDLGFVTFNLSISDVLNSKRFGQITSDASYYQETSRRREMRYAKLGMTFRFGKMDSSIFKLKKLKKDGGQNINGGDGLDY